MCITIIRMCVFASGLQNVKPLNVNKLVLMSISQYKMLVCFLVLYSLQLIAISKKLIDLTRIGFWQSCSHHLVPLVLEGLLTCIFRT